jgi:hypothetical protein
MAIAGGAQSLAAGNYYIGLWFNGTTGPSLRTCNTNTSVNAGTAAPTLLWATADSGLTTTGPNPFGAQTALGFSWWVALS